MELRPFKTETVLSLATGIPFGPQEDVLELVNYMHNQTVHHTRLPEAMKLCRKRIGNEYEALNDAGALRLQFDQMKGIVAPGCDEDMAAIFLRHWIAAMKRICGETISLFTFPYFKDLTQPKA